MSVPLMRLCLAFLDMIDEFLLHASCGKRTGHV